MESQAMESSGAAVAEFPPSQQFIRAVLARVEMHVAGGNWAIALRTLHAAEREWRELQRDHRRMPEDWLRQPLAALGLPTRIELAFEMAGCGTVGECLARVDSPGPLPRGIGSNAVATVWAAAQRLGLGG